MKRSERYGKAIIFFSAIIVSSFIFGCKIGITGGTDNPPVGYSGDPLDPALPDANVEVIFDEALHSEFQAYAWGSAAVNMASDSNPLSGNVCISVAGSTDGSTYWGDAIDFHRVNASWNRFYEMAPSQYKNITFYFNHGSLISDDTDVSITLGSQAASQNFNMLALSDYLPPGTEANTWYKVTIPVTDLNPDNAVFTQVIFDNNGNSNFHYYLDCIFLEWIVDAKAPVISGISQDAGYNKITVIWNTDEPASSIVNYGMSASSLDGTVTASGYSSSHSVVIPNLSVLSDYYYQIISEDSSGNSRSSDVIAVSTTDVPTTGDVTFSIDSTSSTPISRFIYGANGAPNLGLDDGIPYTYTRMGGNRWTAYNWETNASNAGSDWYFWNDGYISDSNVPGKPVIDTITTMHNHNAAALVTIPIAGFVAADKNQTNVFDTPNHIETRFHINKPFKGSALSAVPDTTDNYVYQDEFVQLLKDNFPYAETDPEKKIFFDLDNEPGLWSSTHEEIHPEPVTYAEIIEKSIDYGMAVKSIMPDAKVFGFVAYGYNAYVNLQGASDSSLGDFIDYYLTQMNNAADDRNNGERIIDGLDLHWYPEAMGDGMRITQEATSPGIVEARMQAPRSLWDDTYTEDSWISQWMTNGPIRLIPRIKQKIADNYPGTEFVISEYYYGGGDHISGGIAEADVLGIFGRDGVYAASLWPSGSADETFIKAAFRAYLNYDGAGSGFGDLSISAISGNHEQTSVYASLDSADSDRMVLIAINKTDGMVNADFNLSVSGGNFTSLRVFQINESSPTLNSLGSTTVNGNFSYALFPYSITVLELTR